MYSPPPSRGGAPWGLTLRSWVHGAASVDPREQGCRWEPRGSPTYGAWPPKGGPDGTPYIGGGSFYSKFAGKSASFTCKFTCNHLGLFARLITLFSISSMVLLQHACVFFWRFLESRNYKIQIVAHVEGRSVALLSGTMEASYSHFFIGRGFNCSRGRFRCSSIGLKNYH